VRTGPIHEEIVVSPVRIIHLPVAILAGLATALVAVVAAAPAALATGDPAGPGARPRHPLPFPPHAHSGVTGGLPGWQIALIAAVALLAAASLAVADYRVRAVRPRMTVGAA
jgi:hypothetical protein